MQVRVRRPWCLWLAGGTLFLALVWPLGELAHESLAAHMAQHLVLIGVAAPLLVLSRASMPFFRGMKALGLLLRTPAGVAFALHAAAIWAGHAPAVIEWALAYWWAHAAEHAAFLGTGALFWWSLLRPGRAGAGAAALWSLATLVHTGLLGALITFSPRLIYPALDLEEQQLAGLVMWIPGAIPYLGAGLGFASLWISAPACNRS